MSRRVTFAIATMGFALAGGWSGVAAPAAGASAGYVWWEAENPSAGDFPPNAVKGGSGKEAEILSGGKWIGVDGKYPDAGYFLEYKIAVPRTADYDFYVRKFWKHGPFRWRFDEQPWQEVGPDCTLLDNAELRMYWGANWVPAGSVTLKAGTHTLRIELTRKEGAAYFDAFCLTDQPFIARGKFRPDDPWPAAPEGWFTFVPPPEAAESPLDLRRLNERTAGEHGFIRADGERLVRGDGQPIRFWAVCSGHAVAAMPRPQIDRLARFLARRGVNLIRWHGPVCVTSGPQAGAVDAHEIDNLQYAIEAFKREGIYSHLSIYFPLWLRLNQNPDFPGFQDKPTFAVQFFDPKFQAMYRSWWKALLTGPDPYGGKPLVEDPAIMGCELLNEDSFFFWTFDAKNIPAPEMELLEREFGAWLVQRYGALDKAFAAWGGKPVAQDDAAGGRAGFVPLWALFNTRGARERDTARFLAETQRRFFDEQQRYLRQLGFKGITVASNWTTASNEWLQPLEKWSNAGCDVMDLHGYFGAIRKKNTKAFGIAVGDQYMPRSAARWNNSDPTKPDACDVPFVEPVWNGKPAMTSEYTWMNPNPDRGEMMLIASAYFSLHGTDVPTLFALDTASGWQASCSGYWPVQSPTDAGQFPAAAFLYRQGLVRESEAVVTANANLQEILDLKGGPSRSGPVQDFNRAGDRPAGADESARGPQGVDPRAFGIGKVAITIDDGPRSFKADLSKYIDESAKTVVSATGELRWRYGDGLVQIEAAGAQGAAGFLSAAGEIRLPAMSIRSGNDYGAVMAVALDGKPLATSSRLLLQVMTEERDSGWKTKRGAKGWVTIADVGAPPIEVRKIAGTVAFSRPDAARLTATAYDAGFNKIGSAGTADKLELKPDVFYYLIERP